MTDSPATPTPTASTGNSAGTLMLTLYVVGSAINSIRATVNLKAICEARFAGGYQLEIVDIYDEPLRAIADRVLVTPTLVKRAPAPTIRIMGDLRDTETVVLALRGAQR